MDGSSVVITGVGGPAGRSAATFLRDRGASVTATDMRDVPLEGARFARTPPAASPSFVDALLDVVQDCRATLLVPTVTEELPIVARLRDDLARRGCAVFISPASAVRVADDKLETARALSEAHLAVPRSFDAATDRARLVDELGLPVLSKPRHGRGARGVAVLRTRGEVAGETRSDVVFQEFIPGQEFDVNLFVLRGAPVAGAVLRKTRLTHGLVGNAAGVERADRPEILRLATAAALALGLEGPLDVDVRLRADGGPALLELNARLGANVLAAPEVLDALVRAWGSAPWA